MSRDRATVWRGDRDCRSITRRHAKTFYFASVCLDRRCRTDAYRVYGFCRWVDNLVDDADDPSDARRRLDHARDVLGRVYDASGGSPATLAFRRTVKERGIPREPFADLLDGMEMDLVKDRYEDFAELELYCHRVAGVVGHVMSYIFGFRDPACLVHARELGIAMQLTNILRDVREDHERGRIYLPRDEREAFGIDEAAIAMHRVDDRFREFMQGQIERARRYYRSSDQGVADLEGPANRLCVRLMGRLYGQILDAIESLDHDVYRARASVPFGRKLWTLAACQGELVSDGWRSLWLAPPPPPPRARPL